MHKYQIYFCAVFYKLCVIFRGILSEKTLFLSDKILLFYDNKNNAKIKENADISYKLQYIGILENICFSGGEEN